jgi:hypothetical protein
MIHAYGGSILQAWPDPVATLTEVKLSEKAGNGLKEVERQESAKSQLRQLIRPVRALPWLFQDQIMCIQTSHVYRGGEGILESNNAESFIFQSSINQIVDQSTLVFRHLLLQMAHVQAMLHVHSLRLSGVQILGPFSLMIILPRLLINTK